MNKKQMRQEIHDCEVRANALMGVINEIDNFEDANLVARRAIQWEQQAAAIAKELYR